MPKLLLAQIGYLTADDSEAATDSELSLSACYVLQPRAVADEFAQLPLRECPEAKL